MLTNIFTPDTECQEVIWQFANKLPLNIFKGQRPSNNNLGRATCINPTNSGWAGG